MQKPNIIKNKEYKTVVKHVKIVHNKINFTVV